MSYTLTHDNLCIS